MKICGVYIYFNLAFTLLAYWKCLFEGLSIYVNISFLIIFVLLFLRSRFPKESHSVILLAILGFVFSILCLPFNQTFGLGSYFILYFYFVQLIYLYIIELSPQALAKVSKFTFILLLIYIVLPNPDVNSNSISQSFFAFGISTSILINPRNFKQMIKYTIVLIIVILGILSGESRMSLGAFLFYVILRTIPTIWIKNKSVVLTMLVLLTVGSLLYAFVYTYMWWADIDLSVFEELSAEHSNKHIYSGRQLIWLEAYELFMEHPITGFGSKSELSSFASMNLHNSLIAFYGIYGCIIGTISLYLMIKPAYNLSSYLNNPYIKNCFCGYLASLLMGFNETYLLNYSFIAFFPLIIAYAQLNYYKKRNIPTKSTNNESKFYPSNL